MNGRVNATLRCTPCLDQMTRDGLPSRRGTRVRLGPVAFCPVHDTGGPLTYPPALKTYLEGKA